MTTPVEILYGDDNFQVEVTTYSSGEQILWIDSVPSDACMSFTREQLSVVLPVLVKWLEISATPSPRAGERENQ